jgi:hypothetical protein
VYHSTFEIAPDAADNGINMGLNVYGQAGTDFAMVSDYDGTDDILDGARLFPGFLWDGGGNRQPAHRWG